MPDPEEKKDVNQLLEELKQQTEGGASAAAAKGGHDEFIEPEVLETKTNSASNFDRNLSEEEQPKGEDPAEVTESIRKSSSRYVKLFNTLLKLIFPPIYRSTILQKDDIKKMQDYRMKHTGKSDKQIDDIIHSDHEMWPVVNRFDKYMEAVKDIPLDPEEQEMIVEPLSEVLSKYKKAQLSPGWQLCVTATLIMVPRIMPALPDALSKIFKSK